MKPFFISLSHASAVCCLFALLSVLSAATSESWNVDADGNWTDTGNWTNTTVPDGVGDTATFSNAITSARTVTLNDTVTVGDLVVDDGQSYTFTGTGTIIFDDSGGGPAIITIDNGGHYFDTTLTLQLDDDLNVNNRRGGGY